MSEKQQSITVLPINNLTVSENLDILRFHLNCLYLEGFSKESSNVLTNQKADKRFFSFFFFMFCFVFLSLGCSLSASCNHSNYLLAEL